MAGMTITGAIATAIGIRYGMIGMTTIATWPLTTAVTTRTTSRAMLADV